MSGLNEVARTQAQAEAMPMPPLLILDRVEEFLDASGLGSGPLHCSRIGEGASNVTFRIKRRGVDVVLRRGPRPPLPPSTHDMVREAHIQHILAPLGIAVPKILAVCADLNVLGVPFYVMQFLDGDIITDVVPAHLDTSRERREISAAVVDTLVKLHRVDISRGEIAGIGRPDGYLKRQVARFASLWDAGATRDLPQVRHLGTWLEANRPDTQRSALIHGDYRLGNLMFRAQGPARVQAVLDWEMATLGDPLADLGYLTATYAQARTPGTVMELSSVTAQPGFLNREELAHRYNESFGLDLSPLPWYQALALWKAAIFTEAIYTRWLRGEHGSSGGPGGPGGPGSSGAGEVGGKPGQADVVHPELGAMLEHGVPKLLEAAAACAKKL